MTGLDRRALNALRDRARQDCETELAYGGVEGCQFALAHKGEILWEEGFGAAKAGTPILLLSITKTVLEAALWKLFEDGLDPATRVIDHIPDFMDGVAPEITIEMIETHLGAFASQKLDFPDCRNRETRLAAFRAWRPEGTPGAYYEYSPINGAWVLAEIIERVSGQDYRAYLRSAVLEPLNLASINKVSLGESEAAQVRTLKHLNFMNGWTPDPALRQPMGYGLDTIEGLAVGTPGAGGVGTATGVALLYQAYLHNPNGLWNDAILEDARTATRVHRPDRAGRPIMRTRSFVQAGAREERYGERMFFGDAVSALAFGHQGQGGQIAWCDPQTGLSFSYLTNTVVFPPGGNFHPRARTLSGLAAQVLTANAK